VTQHFPTRQLRFFLTAPSPCPYLPDRYERKVFAHLPLSEGASVNDSLTQVGFRRSQNIAYRPACEACTACVSARLPAADYVFARSERKAIARNEALTHTGNVAFALSAAVIGTFLALQGIFVAAAVFAAGMIPSALLIRENQVDYEAARAGGGEEQKSRRGWRDLFGDKRVLTFTACVVLYYFANAATLPLVSQILTQAKQGSLVCLASGRRRRSCRSCHGCGS